MRHWSIPVLLLATSAAAQDACEDAWFTRNLLMDRAGYCFGSPLGKALFDNSDCTGSDITLSPDVKFQVEAIKRFEASNGCTIDTSRTTLEIDDISIRRQLRDLPMRGPFESACLGWLGEGAALRVGHDDAAHAIGQVEMGDFIMFSYLTVGDWSYVTTHDHDFTGLKAGGWVPNTIFPEEACAEWAG
ncbi:DUF4453 domain-containing protein [uncultured Roseovarius sp.]|uniref:DUF4453 domain-containing protein n=1 Tax=uncultured Roseovarius sp. TaxID=293344 RepID=UPI002610DA8E|nr:DUF4453 domain-containing protein [uncultured Roseovarius sp.]